MILANTNTFGVELETLIPVASLTANGWAVGAYHVGADIADSGGWKTMRDGSIHPDDYTFTGVEVVSPVLSGAAGIASVDAMVARLHTMGAKVNASCGLHVHVGFNGTAQQLARLISLVSYHEKALYAATGTKSREANQYCASIKLAYKPLEKMRSMSEMRGPGSNRYRALNLQNLIDGRRPTVEFRIFAGTLNSTKIKTYIQICLGLVQRAMTMEVTKTSWDRKGADASGSTAMSSMLGALGWEKSSSNVKTLSSGDSLDMAIGNQRKFANTVVFGLITGANLPAMLSTMIKMAAKYDAAV